MQTTKSDKNDECGDTDRSAITKIITPTLLLTWRWHRQFWHEDDTDTSTLLVTWRWHRQF